MISHNLFREVAQHGYTYVQLAGFDVEKPDLIDRLEIESLTTEEIYVPQPVIEVTKCKFCGICSGYCTEKAIQFNRFVPSVTLIVSRCCACGNCQKACSRNGIKMKEKHVGKIVTGRLGMHQIIAGKLDPESEFKIPLIKALLERLNPEAICICDFEPGLDLAVKVALEAMDVAVIVLQNKPDWKQHLDEMIAITGKSKILTGLVLNKTEENSSFLSEVEEDCNLRSLPIWGIIPDFGTLENKKVLNINDNSKIFMLPVTGIWDAITKSHSHYQSTYNETFTQH